MGKMEKVNDEMMENVAGGTLSQEEALGKALSYAGLRRDQVDFVKHVELDYEHGRKVYEVKFYQGGIDVDAENGNILKFEKDYD